MNPAEKLPMSNPITEPEVSGLRIITDPKEVAEYWRNYYATEYIDPSISPEDWPVTTWGQPI